MKTNREFLPGRALVRSLPKSFADSLKEHPPLVPIDVELAQHQHRAYVEAVRALVPEVYELKADEAHPDCCFVEDTAVVHGGKALVNVLGAPERRGEEFSIRNLLVELGLGPVTSMSAPATLDGGDVLIVGEHLFVGLSKRTNYDGVRFLSSVFGDELKVCPVPLQEGLHLKSVMSAFDPSTVLFGECLAGRAAFEFMNTQFQFSEHFEHRFLPDPIVANVLSIGSTILMQDGFPRSDGTLEELAQLRKKELIRLNLSEMRKADGALTCCSILF